MKVTMPCLAVRFSIEKVEEIESLFYGRHCWKVFFEAVDLADLKNAELYEGDTAATLNGREYTYALAIQSPDSAALERLRTSLEGDDVFQGLADETPFAEGSAVDGEPLPDAGRFDANGNLVVPEGRIYNSEVVLDGLGNTKTESQPQDAGASLQSEQTVDASCVAIRFDITRAKEKAGRQYAGYCWRVLFGTVNPGDIAGLCKCGDFYEGTVQSDRNTYLIGLDMVERSGLREVQDRLQNAPDFVEVAASPMFEGYEQFKGGPLRSAGGLGPSGNISVPHGETPGWHPSNAPAKTSGKPSGKGCLLFVLASVLLLAVFGHLLLSV